MLSGDSTPCWTRALPVPLVALIALGVVTGAATAQTRPSFMHGQNVSPAYEGWEEDDAGRRYFLFGYMNRNWEEELDVPTGPDNFIEPGGPDAGQPTHFLPRRNRFVFRVPVPEGFDDDDEMVWTLTTAGVTEQAYATVRLDYLVNDLVQASEQGALGAGRSDPIIRANTAPVLRIEGDRNRRVRVGEPLALVAVASDDGVPKPRRRRRRNPWRPPVQVTVGSATGLRVSWYVYRSDGPVTFDPPQVKVWEDTRTGANSPWSPGWLTPDPPPGRRVGRPKWSSTSPAPTCCAAWQVMERWARPKTSPSRSCPSRPIRTGTRVCGLEAGRSLPGGPTPLGFTC